MIKNVFFWGAKYKAGIIYDLIINDKITENTKNLSLKNQFATNLEAPKCSSNAVISNQKVQIKE